MVLKLIFRNLKRVPNLNISTNLLLKYRSLFKHKQVNITFSIYWYRKKIPIIE